jgi:excisionase family DNA binding protein
MPRIHVSLAGHEIKYDDPDPKLGRFLQKAFDLASDPKVKSDTLIALIYGSENPILDHTVFPERGAVTREVLENPVYHVLSDLLARKQAAAAGVTPDKMSKHYTLTVPEAAEQLGVSEDTINRGIRARRVPSWVKGGQRYLDPRTLAAVAIGLGARGKAPEGFMRLKVRVGASETGSLRVKHAGGELPTKAQAIPYAIETTLPRSQHVAVLTAGADGTLRMFVLEPAEAKKRHGFDDFWFEGNFEIAKKINGAAAARKAWESFKAS